VSPFIGIVFATVGGVLSTWVLNVHVIGASGLPALSITAALSDAVITARPVNAIVLE
jgi:hypothetical protein